MNQLLAEKEKIANFTINRPVTPLTHDTEITSTTETVLRIVDNFLSNYQNLTDLERETIMKTLKVLMNPMVTTKKGER